MNIRFATKEDKEQVLDLLDELIKEVNLQSGKPPKFSSGRESQGKLYDEILQRDDVKIFVVEENGKLLAVADLFILPIMRRGYNYGHIEDFVVTKNTRGKGVGTQLMNAIKDYCREHSIKVIKLTTALELTSAHKFYEKQEGKFTEKMYRFDL